MTPQAFRNEAAVLTPVSAGLAGLLQALQPRGPESVAPPPPPDLDAIRQSGWEAGFVAGENSAETALAPLRLWLAEAAEALRAACTIDADRLRPQFNSLVRAVAEAVLAAELRAGSMVLEPLVTAALAQLQPGDEPTLVAHPDVLAALAPHLPDIATRADPAMPIDGFAVSGSDFIIDACLTARLDQVLGGFQ